MLGELNASHTGCRFFSGSPEADSTAAFGAFFDPDYKGNGVRIQEVIEKGPLVTAAGPIHAGMIIENINGTTVTPEMDISPLLNHLAGQTRCWASSILQKTRASRSQSNRSIWPNKQT